MASRTGNNKNCQAENGGGLFSHQDKQDQAALNIMSKTTAHTMEQLTPWVSQPALGLN